MRNPSLRAAKLAQEDVYISCVVPAHNESAVIIPFLNALTEQLERLSAHYEIIVVNDGSTDDTATLLKNHQAAHLKQIHFSRNFGKEIALSAGLQHCSGEVAILIDCDFQHPLSVIPVFLERWAEGFDMVYGVRANRDNETTLKRWFANLFYQLMKGLTKTDIPPNAGDFRLLNRSVIDALNQINESNRFMKGLYAWVGFNSVAVPFNVEDRAAGKSSWRFRKLTELAITGITSFSEIPLRIWGLMGIIISLISFAYALIIVGDTLLFGVEVPGYATLVVAIMFFGGIQLISIGILGEYIGRIFNEVKNRPKYIIADKLGFDEK